MWDTMPRLATAVLVVIIKIQKRDQNNIIGLLLFFFAGQ
jgi:hypothetical protein